MFPLKDNIPTRRFPVVTVALILANVLMFVLFQGANVGFGGGSVNEGRVVEYGAIPYELTHPGTQCIPQGEALACGPDDEAERVVGADLAATWLTVFTSMFMHGGLLHLGGNMMFLWIFGNNIEDSMARVRFLLFYLLGGVAALAAQTLLSPDAAVPTIGASGAVAAVLGGYALLYPRARVITVIFLIFFFQFVELPAMVLLGLWFLLQLLYGVFEAAQPVAGGGVAYWAHIGGFAFGLLLIRLFANRAKSDYLDHSRLPVY